MTNHPFIPQGAQNLLRREKHISLRIQPRYTSGMLYRVFALFLGASSLQADVLYSQEPRRSDLRGLRSHSQGEQQAAELFRLNNPARVEKVTWHGFFFPNDDPSARTFQIRFFHGTSTSVDPRSFYNFQGNPSRSVAFTVSGGAQSSHPVHAFEMVLPAPVALEANRDYWISIVADGGTVPYFAWQESADGIANWASIPTGGSEWVITEGLPSNLAFTLQGTVVPEPGAITLFSCGALGALLVGTQKRRGMSKVHDPTPL